MRIAAISDIHGDLRSLQAVWNDIVNRGLADAPVLNAGDTVAYGPETMACIEFVRDPDRKIVTVGGNYDINVARFPAKEKTFRQKWGKLRPVKYEALRQASSDLSEEARSWLCHLPAVERMELGGTAVSVSHYAPTHDKEGLFASTPEARLWQIATELDGKVDVAVVGHTHSGFARRAKDVLFVNPGSVGRSFGNPTYAEITIEPDTQPVARIIACRVSQR